MSTPRSSASRSRPNSVLRSGPDRRRRSISAEGSARPTRGPRLRRPPAARDTSGRSAMAACRARGWDRPRVRVSVAATPPISSAEIAPGRSTCGGSTVQSTIVDSTPMGHGPPSKHEVDIVAEVGAHVIGRRRADPAEAVGRRCGEPATEPLPAAPASTDGRARAADGRRPPVTIVEHPRTREARAASAAPASMRRRGPRRRRNRRRPIAERPPAAMWTISGWSAGRPLTAKIRRTASGLDASAASP